MLFHQFGEDLVLALDLFLQVLDPFLFGLGVGSGLKMEGRRAVLKQFLLPAVEDGGLQLQLVTELGDRLLLQQMAPQDGDLLFCGVVLPLFSHAFSPLS
jgi:hypothetical protein